MPAYAAEATPKAVTEAVTETEDSVFIDEVTLAATGCGSTCDGKDPSSFKIYDSGCSTCYHYCVDDAIIPQLSDGYVYTTSDSTGSVSLRYSPRCRTAWAKTTSSAVQFKVVSRNSSGSHRLTMLSNSPDTYTAMVNDAGYEAQACYYPQGPSSGWRCTRWW
ncbi:DUF2690 domain-containing protein [Micromonospora sp. RTGN7]|uniref:DUF2690 domain-containing protein n=1 Tax=Micromonospora sp. RTGN7 TaxID=3016526 RepID=UPI0029FF1C5F|nr:DUF2690 domain-containing protein [Micromonospora sp. RTGN7]